MNSSTATVLLIIAGIGLNCSRSPQGQQVSAEKAQEVTPTAAEGREYLIDTTASLINWEGTEPGDEGHKGTLRLQDGTLQVQDSMLVGGKFTLNMNSISVSDLSGARKAKLESHLKDGDFFETNRFPQGSFEITKVTPLVGIPAANHEISGNLTLRDSTKNVTFPANVSWQGATLVATTPPFTIDRTQWGVVYRSGIIGTLKNKLINDQVGLTIQLTAKPR